MHVVRGYVENACQVFYATINSKQIKEQTNTTNCMVNGSLLEKGFIDLFLNVLHCLTHAMY